MHSFTVKYDLLWIFYFILRGGSNIHSFTVKYDLLWKFYMILRGGSNALIHYEELSIMDNLYICKGWIYKFLC